MECAVITTYRCNARCQMCDIWQHPTKRSEEFTPEILRKLPGGMTRLNITGGEPTVRADLKDIVEILDTKTNRLEITGISRIASSTWRDGSLISQYA
jgi:MoaA/NifB/PqqE/SkfB family radical SAM enzyme